MIQVAACKCHPVKVQYNNHPVFVQYNSYLLLVQYNSHLLVKVFVTVSVTAPFMCDFISTCKQHWIEITMTAVTDKVTTTDSCSWQTNYIYNYSVHMKCIMFALTGSHKYISGHLQFTLQPDVVRYKTAHERCYSQLHLLIHHHNLYTTSILSAQIVMVKLNTLYYQKPFTVLHTLLIVCFKMLFCYY